MSRTTVGANRKPRKSVRGDDFLPSNGRRQRNSICGFGTGKLGTENSCSIIAINISRYFLYIKDVSNSRHENSDFKLSLEADYLQIYWNQGHGTWRRASWDTCRAVQESATRLRHFWHRFTRRIWNIDRARGGEEAMMMGGWTGMAKRGGTGRLRLLALRTTCIFFPHHSPNRYLLTWKLGTNSAVTRHPENHFSIHHRRYANSQVKVTMHRVT